ncbi:MAG: ATP-dependent Clp protease adapter ClpS [Spirochaetales bacterium]|nr:MAG: ATP-dependent Clp protease adapter ClpS [Spirochaetales bacterium]
MVADHTDIRSDVLVEDAQETKEPDEYRVLLLNDDFTTMEFVVAVLVSVFHKSIPEATRIMLDVHRKGKGIVGVYTYDIATTKIQRVHAMARENSFPLRCTMEKA